MAQVEEQALPGRIRPQKKPGAIAARIAKETTNLKQDRPVGVQPLNPGFFTLEAIRRSAVAKKKTAQRAAPKGK
mgnify:CR=1 FL=1